MKKRSQVTMCERMSFTGQVLLGENSAKELKIQRFVAALILNHGLFKSDYIQKIVYV